MPAHRPFCSVRCSEVDLQRWLVGTYAVPAEEGEEQPSDEPGDDPGQGRHGSL